jgi:Xaa-Pro aminopeptidase
MSDTAVPSYSLQERDRRWALTRSFMEREGLDAVVVFGEHEDAGSAPFYIDTWFTNDRPGATVVFPLSGELISLSSFATDHQPEDTGGDRVWVAAQNTRLGRGAAALGDVIDELGLGTSTVGIAGVEPYGPWHPEGVIPYRLWSTIQSRFPEAKFRPIETPDLASLLAPLSAEEIEVVRYSAKIGDAMVQAMVEAAAPGVAENVVYGAGMAAAFEHGTIVPVMLLASGPAPMGGCPPQWAFRPQAPRVLRSGDVLRAEVFCNFGMRSTQHQVTMAIGEVHRDFEAAALVARQAYDVGLKALRPGRVFGEVVDEMREPIQSAGGLTGHPVIHSLNPFGSRGGGIPTTNAGMELQPGMSFALEPGCTFNGHKVTLGGTVIIGEAEAIELNPFTAQLLHAQGAEVADAA